MATYLGIELGSTRIKAVTVDEDHRPCSSGDFTWAAELKNGLWTYDLNEAWKGLRAALRKLKERDQILGIGISGMMHGYLAFDKDWNLLVPFRTWQNTVTAEAAAKLTALFGVNIPQRWCVAHLYQAVLNEEEHIGQIAHITTLAGYVHYMLTGVHAVGIGEASGIFPIRDGGYDREMLCKINKLLPWNIEELLPQVLPAGAAAGCLTPQGVERLEGLLPAGLPFAPPEGDAGTGMVATNAVAPRTGNVSAGTSLFAMVVLERPLSRVYEELDIVATPAGRPVAMVHCNNGTNDSNAWVALLKEAAELLGGTSETDETYARLYRKALEGEADCGGVVVCNYLAGEGITHLDAGCPMVVRTPKARFTLANFFRANLYATMATLKLGMALLEEEHVRIDRLAGHGGLFKTPTVGQRFMAAACNAPITCMETAGDGGPYGMALLVAYSARKAPDETLEAYLNDRVFAAVSEQTLAPDPLDVQGFHDYMERYKKLLKAEKIAAENL